MGLRLQRANTAKRISAWLFDGILLVIAAVLCAWLLASVVGFDSHYDRLLARYDAIAQQYALDREALSAASYHELSDETKALVEEANAALATDPEALYAYQMVTQLMVLIISLGVLLAHLGLEFAVPLAFGDGRTLGKKIFGIAVMRTNCVRINPVCLFIRAILGKYAVETMLPVMAVGMLMIGAMSPVVLGVIAILFLVQCIVFLANRNRPLIHDLLADTITVDFASQRIFASTEALIAYQKAAHAQKAAHDDLFNSQQK